LLKKLEGPVTVSERIREVRAVEILEHIATPEAVKILKRLSRGAPESRLTWEAMTSLKRRAERGAANH
jgi:hypothetical protein